jgi:RNA recognition motif-containing protein
MIFSQLIMQFIVNGFSAHLIHFARRSDAERAKRDLHMQIFNGRPMQIEWYRQQVSEQSSGAPGEVGSGPVNRNEPVVSIHVRFMGFDVRQIFSLFSFIYLQIQFPSLTHPSPS